MQKHYIVLPEDDSKFSDAELRAFLRSRHNYPKSAENSAIEHARSFGQRFFVYELQSGTRVEVITEQAK